MGNLASCLVSRDREEGGSTVNYDIYSNFHSNTLSETESVIFYSSIFASSED